MPLLIIAIVVFVVIAVITSVFFSCHAHAKVHLAALDLVDGTPVYDIKPCVPWDAPAGAAWAAAPPSSSASSSAVVSAGAPPPPPAPEAEEFVVPSWVRGDDERSVQPMPVRVFAAARHRDEDISRFTATFPSELALGAPTVAEDSSEGP